MRSPMMDVEVGRLWNQWPQMQVPNNASNGELYQGLLCLLTSTTNDLGLVIKGTIPLMAFITSI